MIRLKRQLLKMIILLFIIVICVTSYNNIRIKHNSKHKRILAHMGIIKKNSALMKFDKYQETNYKLEKEALLLIKENYNCICKNKANHFPKLIKYDDKRHMFYLSINGVNLNDYKLFLNLNVREKIKIQNKEEQIDCIIHNLNKCKIKHLDLLPKNVCINYDGIISLIDFDMCAINNKPHGIVIRKRYKSYTQASFREQFLKIINEVN